MTMWGGMAAGTDILACPICMERLKDPFVTQCGHSFCYSCVTTHLHNKSTCPSCATYLIPDKIFPNHLLSQIVANAAKEELIKKGGLVEQLQEAIASDQEALKLPDVELLLGSLEEKRHDMQQKEQANSLNLLLHFLEHSRQTKTLKLHEIREELEILNRDIHQVSRQATLPLSGMFSNRLSLTNGETPMPNGIHSSLLSQHKQGLEAARDQTGHNIAEQHPVGVFHMPAAPSARGNPTDQGRDAEAILNDWQARASRMTDAVQPGNSTGSLPFGNRPSLAGRDPSGHQEPSNQELDGSLPAPSSPQASARSQPSSISAGAGWQNFRSGSHDAGPSHPRASPPSATGGAMDQSDGVQSFRPQPSPLAPTQAPLGPGADEPAGGGPGLAHGPDPAVLQPRQPGVSRQSSELRHASDAPNASGMTTSGMAVTTTTEDSGARSSLDDADQTSSLSRKRRMESQFEDLQSQYLRMRQKHLQNIKRRRPTPSMSSPSPLDRGALQPEARALTSSAKSDMVVKQELPAVNGRVTGNAESAVPFSHDDSQDMREFSRTLSLCTSLSKLETLASISGSRQQTSAAILSSVAFNMDARIFATAGVSKRVSIFNYGDVIRSAASSPEQQASNKPIAELMTPSKLSCIAWNWYIAPHLVSSDYEGVVTLWDTHAQQALAEFEAHRKRIWSVDCCPTDGRLLASASDDGTVKVWSTAQQAPVADLDLKANLCCVRFSPHSPHELAAGSADHNVHVFDLRNASKPLHVFPGHKKSVSYVRYMTPSSIVSSSTDSTLRLWSSQPEEHVRTYSGHLNEKNFVGLSVDGEFIACGSETSEVFVYYRSISKPIAKTVFAPSRNAEIQGGLARSNAQFISALSWKPQSDEKILLAASSQGAIKLLQLNSGQEQNVEQPEEA